MRTQLRAWRRSVLTFVPVLGGCTAVSLALLRRPMCGLKPIYQGLVPPLLLEAPKRATKLYVLLYHTPHPLSASELLHLPQLHRLSWPLLAASCFA